MIEIETNADKIILHIQGMSKIWSLKRQLMFSNNNLKNVYIKNNAHIPWYALRLPGTCLPGIISAGTFYIHRRRIFADIREGHSALVLCLQHESYDQVFFQTKDLYADLARIQEVIPRKS